MAHKETAELIFRGRREQNPVFPPWRVGVFLFNLPFFLFRGCVFFCVCSVVVFYSRAIEANEGCTAGIAGAVRPSGSAPSDEAHHPACAPRHTPRGSPGAVRRLLHECSARRVTVPRLVPRTATVYCRRPWRSCHSATIASASNGIPMPSAVSPTGGGCCSSALSAACDRSSALVAMPTASSALTNLSAKHQGRAGEQWFARSAGDPHSHPPTPFRNDAREVKARAGDSRALSSRVPRPFARARKRGRLHHTLRVGARAGGGCRGGLCLGTGFALGLRVGLRFEPAPR